MPFEKKSIVNRFIPVNEVSKAVPILQNKMKKWGRGKRERLNWFRITEGGGKWVFTRKGKKLMKAQCRISFR